jgi:hypothetical protein
MTQKLANEALTRIRNPHHGQSWKCPRVYMVGEKGEKNGQPYTVRFFSVSSGGFVYANVRFQGDRNYTPLWIGERGGFQERLVEIIPIYQ